MLIVPTYHIITQKSSVYHVSFLSSHGHPKLSSTFSAVGGWIPMCGGFPAAVVSFSLVVQTTSLARNFLVDLANVS